MTAFAIGHSITLALATLGLVRVPIRPVEALIVISILVSAIHALRPLLDAVALGTRPFADVIAWIVFPGIVADVYLVLTWAI